MGFLPVTLHTLDIGLISLKKGALYTIDESGLPMVRTPLPDKPIPCNLSTL
jgi:hypothetical protein